MAAARLALLGALISLCVGARAAGIDWHPTWEAALKAAQRNSHIAYIFVYLPGRAACGQMDEFSFRDRQVLELMKNVEAAAVNASSPEGGRFVEQYKLPWIRDPERSVKLAVVPTHAFFGPDGAELHRQSGFVPPAAFRALVERVTELQGLNKRVASNPKDAAAQARLGHLLLLLNQEVPGRRHLELAIALDPENRAGACERARLDLAILGIKQDPSSAIDRLRRWLDTYGRSSSHVEAQFYLATAYVAAGRTSDAEKVLLPFRDAKKGTLEADSEWGARARALLRELPNL